MKKAFLRSKRIIGAIALLFVLMLAFATTANADEFDCEAQNHQFETVTYAPTGTQDGSARFTCRICGYQYTQILYATNHHWSEWIVSEEATCSQPGERYRTCTATQNAHTESETIPALLHTYRPKDVPASCTQGGYTQYACTRCGNSYQNNATQALGHQYHKSVDTPATCTNAGSETFSCEVCGDNYTQEIAPLDLSGHQYAHTETSAPTCETAGHSLETCTTCGETKTQEIAPIGHAYGEWFVYKEESVFKTGEMRCVCANNARHIQTETIPSYFTLEINVVDAVMMPVNIALILFFLFALLADMYVILWDLNKRKKSSKAKRMKENYIKLAAFLALTVLVVPVVLLGFIRGVTYFNLFSVTMFTTVMLAGIVLNRHSQLLRRSLQGNGGIFEKGSKGANVISNNKRK